MASHSILEMGDLLMIQERERLLSKILRRQRIDSLAEAAVIEAGCSTGYNLRLFVQWGADPRNAAGIDISEEATSYVRQHSPEIRVHTGSAEAIPEADEAFDFALAFTLFSSIRDEDVSHGIARELFRVTKPGGLIFVYDMRRSNPRNPAVHKILMEDVRRWFPTCPARMHRLTLAPPVARRVGRWAPALYGPLAAVPLLRTHAMFELRRPALPLR